MSGSVTVWVADLGAYSLQVALLVAAGLGLAGLFHLRPPAARLAFAQALLLAAVLLPALQPWQPRDSVAAGGWFAEGSAAPASPRLGVPWAAAIALLLAAGAGQRLFALTRRVWRLRGYRRLARPMEASPLVKEAAALVGVAPRVYLSDGADVPATFGALRPAIVLPPRFTGLPEGAQRAILCHEMLHVRRHDWLQALAEEVVRAVLWFHPCVWWLLARIRLAREQAVDERAVRLTGARREYLETLLQMARPAAARPPAAALFLTESHLKGRVALLLEEVAMSKKRVMAGLAASAAGVVLAGAAAVRAFPLQSPTETKAADVAGGIEGGVDGGVQGGVDGGVPDGVAGGVPGGVEGGVAEATANGKPKRPRKLVHSVNPVYPEAAKGDGVEGVVQLRITIEPSGAVSDAVVVEGPEPLRAAAVAAARQFRFEADEVGPVEATYAFDFKLKDKHKEVKVKAREKPKTSRQR